LEKIYALIFIFAEEELVTPPLTDGLILPGVTRDSLLELCRQWNEFKITERYPSMEEVKRAISEKRASFKVCVLFNYIWNLD
jgi:branched-subunit amino acid aminotransferase/4-amino-4-deoxychorismate lyase